MALIDKIAPDVNGNIQLGAHEFSAALYLIAIGEFTQNQVSNALGLEASDDAQLTQVVNHINGLPAGEKLAFHGKIEALNIALQRGYITKATYKSRLGMT